jgi:hypothetical protein
MPVACDNPTVRRVLAFALLAAVLGACNSILHIPEVERAEPDARAACETDAEADGCASCEGDGC